MKKSIIFLFVSVVTLSLLAQNNAAFVSQNVPTAVLPGQTFTVSITMQNTGTTVWTDADNYHLGSQSPQDNLNWGLNRVYLNSDVNPGDQYTFTFDATAPTTPGVYNFQWQMVQDGVEWFGDYTPILQITVDTINDAEFVSFSGLPTSLHPGEQFSVTITMKNTGTTTWTASDNYKLGSWYPVDNFTWGTNRIYLTSGSVAPGQNGTFKATLTAPMEEGLYNFQWKMVQDGVEWFGDSTTLKFIPVMNDLQDSLFTPPTHKFSASDHVIGTTLFHWFVTGGGQVSGPWIPINGRDSWDGSVTFWKWMIKQLMAADIDVLYVIVIPSMEEQRGNLFMALYQLRAEGWDVPKVCPFFDPMITYTIYGHHGNAATQEGKDEIVGHYIRFYKQYFAVNKDPYADDYIYTQDNRPVLNVWHVNTMIDNYDQLTRNDVTSRLSAAFGTEHPIFNNDIVMITNEISPSFSFADEKVAQFELQEYYHITDYNNVQTCLLKPGYWDQNVRDPGYCLHRDGGTHYRSSWNDVVANAGTIDRVQIESFNEYDEGSGIYAARTDTIYRIPNNTENDVWSDSNDPWEYIKDTYNGAKQFNMYPDYGARIIWHNFPDTMIAGDTVHVTVLVRNDGDNMWNAANEYKFGEQEFQDPVQFGATRYFLDDTQNDIPVFGGIFRGRVVAFDISLVAPDTAGTFLTHWGMVREGYLWIDTVEIPITVIQVTNNNVVTTMNDFTIYPNPSNGTQITINGNFAAGSTVYIINAKGQTVWTKTINENKTLLIINKKLSSGSYFLKINNGKREITKKIIVK